MKRRMKRWKREEEECYASCNCDLTLNSILIRGNSKALSTDNAEPIHATNRHQTAEPMRATNREPLSDPN